MQVPNRGVTYAVGDLGDGTARIQSTLEGESWGTGEDLHVRQLVKMDDLAITSPLRKHTILDPDQASNPQACSLVLLTPEDCYCYGKISASSPTGYVMLTGI